MNAPSEKQLRRIARQHRLENAILIYVKGGQLGCVSYGKDRNGTETSSLADKIYGFVWGLFARGESGRKDHAGLQL